MRDYYRILQLDENAGADEIRRAYRQLARTHHPDVSGESAEAFREIRQAYETLSDERRRRAYDARRADSRRPSMSAADRIDWFADEVVVDFPSVGSVLDRMRQSFFGPDDFRPPLSAEILLTPHEAFFGTMVPLEVPVRHTCRSCGGRGETWMEPCGACGGSGEGLLRHEVRLTVPPGVRHGDRFRFSVTPPYAPATLVEVRIAIQ